MITFVYVCCVVTAFVGLLLLTFNPKLGAALMAFAMIACIVTGVIESQRFKIEDLEAQPTAIDVYRGKTTLEITYRDSVVVDYENYFDCVIDCIAKLIKEGHFNKEYLV